MKILIVDDEALIREGIEKRCRKYGGENEIMQAGDVMQAEAMMSQNQIDLAFVDINMPFINGLDFIKQHQNSDILFVIISGYDKFEYAKRAVEYGVFRYLLKPIDRNEFIEVLLEAKRIIMKNKPRLQYSQNTRKIIEVMQNNCMNQNFSLSQCAYLLSLSESSISKSLNQEVKCSFNDLMNQFRIELAVTILKQSEGKVKMNELAMQCGFTSQQYFSAVFKKYMNVSPSQYDPNVNE